MTEVRIESGIETAMMMVDRHSQGTGESSAPSGAAMMPSRITPKTAARTNTD